MRKFSQYQTENLKYLAQVFEDACAVNVAAESMCGIHQQI